MRHGVIHLSNLNADLISYYLYSHGDDNQADRNKMKRILKRAICHELTQRQRDCIIMKYFKNMKNNEIAERLGLSKSTVSRHIKAAESNLKKIAIYYMDKKEVEFA